jgi:AraC-type DNA-binding domain-containing proteins
MEKRIDLSFEESLKPWGEDSVYNRELMVTKLEENRAAVPHQDIPVRIEGLAITLVTRGEMRMNVDCIPYSLGKNMMIESLEKHVVSDVTMSDDLEGYFILVNRDFAARSANSTKIVPSEIMLNKQLNPVSELQEEEAHRLADIIEKLRRNIARRDHYFYDGLIMTSVGGLILELWDLSMKNEKLKDKYMERDSKMELSIRFLQLVRQYCREHHDVSFYAGQLCVTPDYLTRAMKAVSGQTAIRFISRVLVTEAKILLREQGKSMQQIAEELNFFDQSAFGKFFKKHTGLSPMQYKNKLL